jgi:probable phosphoglycerate mutase
MTTLLLFRHGEIEQAEPRRFVGCRDLPLTARGRAQAAAWSPLLANLPIDAAWCSPLSRCRETAALALAANGIACPPIDALREISLGAWEGLTTQQVRERFPQEFARRGQDIAHVAPTGGENFLQAQQRALKAIDRALEHAPRLAAVFAHAGVNRAIICHAAGIDLSRVFSLGQDYAALNILTFAPDRPASLLALNLPAGGAQVRLESLLA